LAWYTHTHHVLCVLLSEVEGAGTPHREGETLESESGQILSIEEYEIQGIMYQTLRQGMLDARLAFAIRMVDVKTHLQLSSSTVTPLNGLQPDSVILYPLQLKVIRKIACQLKKSYSKTERLGEFLVGPLNRY
jgi:hypothetical protein